MEAPTDVELSSFKVNRGNGVVIRENSGDLGDAGVISLRGCDQNDIVVPEVSMVGESVEEVEESDSDRSVTRSQFEKMKLDKLEPKGMKNIGLSPRATYNVRVNYARFSYDELRKVLERDKEMLDKKCRNLSEVTDSECLKNLQEETVVPKKRG